MRLATRCLFQSAGFLACGLAAAGLSGEPLRIATYNLGNYLETGRRVEGRHLPDYPKPEAEKRALRRVVLSVRPDVLALQEIGPPEYLEELRADLAAQGLGFSHAAHMDSVDGQRNLAVLSQVPIRSAIHHDDLDFKYFDQREPVKRGLLEVELATGPEPYDSLCLFVVHLKSRFSSEPKDPESAKRRVSEAEACRDRIVERLSGSGPALYCVAGDFNDHPESATVRRFCQRGDLRIGQRVPAVDERGETWTHHYGKHGMYSTVDGFVVSPRLVPRIAGSKGRIFGDLAGSDHRLVYIDVDFHLESDLGAP